MSYVRALYNHGYSGAAIKPNSITLAGSEPSPNQLA